MCGIAGIIRIDGGTAIPRGIVATMTRAIIHRGPDEEGFLELPGVAFGARRLAIVGIADGRQPVADEAGTIHAVFNGELYDHSERRLQLVARGHRLATSCDTEIIPHLWEDHGPDMFGTLRGQFAIALYDTRARRVVLSRDRFGICPLYWTVARAGEGAFLLFASEIKALLASGMVTAEADLRGLDNTFTFIGQPGPITCFAGINALLPGHMLTVDLGRAGVSAGIVDRAWWDIDFPDRGSEEPGDDRTVERYRELFTRSVERRLRADVPVVSYLSGGVDSSVVLAGAAAVRGTAPPAFTLQIKSPGLDELPKASATAQALGAPLTVIPVTTAEVLEAYPRLIMAAECPVSDTSCAALLLLAEAVHRQGYKVALTGEGSDEMLAGYPWFKLHRLLSPLDALGFTPGNLARRAAAAIFGLPANSRAYDRRQLAAIGGPNAWLDVYGVAATARPRVYGPRLRPLLDRVAYEEIGLDADRMRRWHPLHRSLALGQRIHLSGLLLSTAGDRVAMHSSVETRYPFLDEDLVDYTQRLHPRWKLRGFRDKYLLRQAAESLVPKEVAWRRKAMFRTPWDVLDGHGAGDYLAPLLTRTALENTGYFHTGAILGFLKALPAMRGVRRTLLEQALAGVVMTQLWHHVFIGDLGSSARRYEVAHQV